MHTPVMASTGGDGWRLGHRPALDGIRGIAVLFVVVGHGWQKPLLAAGSTGVAVFFTLSGFLITALLLQEREQTGTIRVRAFWARRAVRLLPALYAFLLAVWLARPLLGDQAPSTAGVVVVVMYVANWFPSLGLALGHTWSLAVEEQFYLVWPVLLVLLVRPTVERVTMWMCWVLAATGLAWRVFLYLDGSVVHSYAGTDTNMSALLIGAATAILVRRTKLHPPLWLLPVAMVVLLGLAFGGDTAIGWLFAPGLAPFPAAVVVLAAARGHQRGLTSRWLTCVGRRSYGLYLWHMPCLMVIGPQIDGPRSLVTVGMIAASWALASLSWHLVEVPAQRWYRLSAGREGERLVPQTNSHSVPESQPGRTSDDGRQLSAEPAL